MPARRVRFTCSRAPASAWRAALLEAAQVALIPAAQAASFAPPTSAPNPTQSSRHPARPALGPPAPQSRLCGGSRGNAAQSGVREAGGGAPGRALRAAPSPRAGAGGRQAGGGAASWQGGRRGKDRGSLVRDAHWASQPPASARGCPPWPRGYLLTCSPARPPPGRRAPGESEV